MITAGIFADTVLPWADETTHTKIESCIADMHFRHNNETQFRECVAPDLKKIEAIQKLITFTTILYSIGGVFVGLGFRTRLKSKKSVKKPDCNCNTPYRCPEHNK